MKLFFILSFAQLLQLQLSRTEPSSGRIFDFTCEVLKCFFYLLTIYESSLADFFYRYSTHHLAVVSLFFHYLEYNVIQNSS
jgi:hypothetical protein